MVYCTPKFSIKMFPKSTNIFHIYDFTAGGSISLARASFCPPCHPNDATTAAPSTAVATRSLGETPNQFRSASRRPRHRMTTKRYAMSSLQPGFGFQAPGPLGHCALLQLLPLRAQGDPMPMLVIICLFG